MSNYLFDEFSAVTPQQWKDKIIADLKGKDYNTLIWKTREGIDVKPFYTKEDIEGLKSNPTKSHNNWQVCQEFFVDDEAAINKKALKALNNGVNSILFYILPNCNLEVLLKDILIEYVALHFVMEGNGSQFLSDYQKLIEKRGLDQKNITGSINIDCIENLARTGNWFKDEASDFEEIKTVLNNNTTSLKTVCINANIYHNAGANTVQELGLALAHANEYITQLGTDAANSIWLNMAVGSNYFFEIAKLRAARQLFSYLFEQYNTEGKIDVFAQTALRNKTIYDPYNNMLRTTTESMAAATGGADYISVLPFDMTYKYPSDFSERIAKNQQLVLQGESYFDKTADPASGSYYIETLTNELCEKAWEYFKQIEAKGGLLVGLKSGSIQQEIEAEAAKQQEAFDNEQEILVGVNKYPNQNEKMKTEATAPLFYRENTKETAIQPLKVIRLAEKLEKERIDNE